MKLDISEDLQLPLEAVTEKLAWIGRTGSGKSYGAQKLAEEMARARAQFVVLDPVGIWYGLRLAADGKSPGLAIPVLGGLHGDIPLEPTAGVLVANLVVDRGQSMILDCSQFESDADKARFACAFADRFFFRKKSSPSAVHVFLEEAQEFVAQNPQKGEEKMLHAFTRMEKLGRNFGIGMSLISQRPQEVNKKALNQTELLFCFQMTGPHERKTIAEWIKEKGIDEDIAAELPKLQRGCPHAWSPAWLNISRVVRIRLKDTLDASSTPKVGKAAASRDLSPIDMDRLRDDMKATIEKAKADDPRELRKKIAELQKQLADRASALTEVQEVVRTVEVPVITNEQMAELKDAIQTMVTAGRSVGEVATGFSDRLDQLRRGRTADGFTWHEVPKSALQQQKPPKASKPGKNIPTISQQAAGDFRPTRTQQRILDAIAWYESLGNPEPSNVQIGAVALIDPTGGHFSNVVGPMSTAGLILRGDGTMRLTTAGRDLAEIPESVGTLDEYHETLKKRVRRMKSASGKTIEMLEFIIAVCQTRGGSEMLTAEQIGQAVGIDHTGGHFSNCIGPLGTAGLIERRAGLVTPTVVLFPRGL